MSRSAESAPRVQPRGSAARLEQQEQVRRDQVGIARGRVISFVMVRLTGLILTVLVLGHFALTHIITDVAETDSSFVAGRWNSWFWLSWDWLLLLTAILHGAAGLWVVIDDYTPDANRRRRRRITLLVLSLAALIAGTTTIGVVIARG